jgi:hypothetical protein
MVLVLAVGIVGAGLWAWSALVAPRRRDRHQDQVVSTSTPPPAHPDAPVPGSDEARRRQRG